MAPGISRESRAFPAQIGGPALERGAATHQFQGVVSMFKEIAMRWLRPTALTALVALAACSQPAASSETDAATDTSASQASMPLTGSAWQLDVETSYLSFVSIKSGDIAEVHRFTGLSGSVSPEGQAELIVFLDTVETGIDIRNERMREHLFQTGTWPEARITTQLNPAPFASMEAGDRLTLPLTFNIDLHGQSLDVDADVIITAIDGGEVLVETAAPVLIHAADFQLTEGLATLQDLASLPSITPVVPVTVSLAFQRS